MVKIQIRCSEPWRIVGDARGTELLKCKDAENLYTRVYNWSWAAENDARQIK